MTHVKVKPGICGFDTTIDVESKDMQNVTINVQTDCPNYQTINDELIEIDSFGEVLGTFGESKVCRLAKKYCKHPSCPIPTAILKGIEVECRLALPQKVEIDVIKDE
ncbi:hypothetical protein SH1V18_22810 [Vallitalea longa]|uniref:Uncharacterized protein n=1 Tax=Vallitalea longa TaxID=2936439 RepID=A0A9W5YC43_9FIRM|nr:hypothetical protein [Vallitalea longa]GKX29801.1 hypothetical protein SH1V18_22810 [Vallitalea longa]